MSNSGIKLNNIEYKNQISEIIQKELIDLHGAKGYKSIIKTMSKICGRQEKEIITNFELFSELAEGIFGRLANSKIIDPIKLEIDKIGIENIHQEEKDIVGRPTRILIAEDDPEILGLYETFFEAKDKEVTLTMDGHKCVEAYKRKNITEQLKNYFDVVILDQKMPIMTGLQAAVEILNINSQQKIIFVSGYLEKALLDVLTRLNRAIAVIEKPFSLDVLEHMINNTAFFEKIEKINLNQEERDVSTKLSEIMTVLQTHRY